MEHAGDSTSRPSPLEDEALIAAARAGDRAARERLARAALHRVRRAVYLMTRRGPDADDLVQVALARAFTRLHTYRGEARLTAWLDRVTVNTVREHYRRRPVVQLLPRLEAAREPRGPDHESPERRADSGRALDGVLEHLAAIRPKKRIALVLSAA